MTISTNKQEKGGNICAKFVSEQYNRDAIYNSISTELTELQQQQAKFKNVFEYTVREVAQALESTNTGWHIDSTFKQNNIIQPITILPTINSEIIAANIESWNISNELKYNLFQNASLGTVSSRNTTGIIFKEDFSDNLWVCANYYISHYDSSENLAPGWGVALSQVNNKGQVIRTYKLGVHMINGYDSVTDYTIIPIALGAYLNAEQHLIVKVFCACTNLTIASSASYSGQVTGSFYYCSKTIDCTTHVSNFDHVDLINFTNFTPKINNNTPWVKAVYNPFSQLTLIATIGSNNKIYYSYLTLEQTTTNLAIYNLNVPIAEVYILSGLFIDTKADSTYLLIRTSSTQAQLYNFFNEWEVSLTDVQLIANVSLLADEEIEFFKLTKDFENYIIIKAIAQSFTVLGYHIDDRSNPYINKQITINGNSFLFEVGVSQLYIAYKAELSTSDQYLCSCLNLNTKKMNNYVRLLPAGINVAMLQTDALYILGGLTTEPRYIYLIQISNKQEESVLVETEDNSPLVSFVNLTHESGAKLQLTFSYHGRIQRLFSTTGSQLYSNDLGFTYIPSTENYSFSTSAIETLYPNLSICSENNNTKTAGLLLSEIIYDIPAGRIEYFVIANKDGNFVSFLVKQDHNIIANIGCGNLIENLQYNNEQDTLQPNTLYYSLGFVQSNLTAVPIDSATKLVAFTAPTYNGYRYYGGTNMDPSIDLLYSTVARSYQYMPNIVFDLSTSVYTMPVLVGIQGSNSIYYFNQQSGFKGQVSRKYLVHVELNDTSILDGIILDTGNYLYLGNNWAIGWDKENSATINPYYGDNDD